MWVLIALLALDGVGSKEPAATIVVEFSTKERCEDALNAIRNAQRISTPVLMCKQK